MRFMPTQLHGVFDYVMGVLLIASPWLLNFNFASSAAATWVPVILGFGVLLTSLMTAYELGAVRLIPMPMHLGTDLLVGIVLIVSPWLFGFADEVWTSHVVLGVLEFGLALTAKKHPDP